MLHGVVTSGWYTL